MEEETSSKASAGATHIALVLDQSGSMEAVKGDTIGSYNAYLESQRSGPDTALWTLTLFNSEQTEDRHTAMPIAEVPALTAETYRPNGWTPLYDAIGRTMARLEDQVQEGDRVLFVILTDGHENASTEYSHAAITAKIAEVEARGNWTVVYLGSTLDAVSIAANLGIARGNTAFAQALDLGMMGMMSSTTRYRGSPLRAVRDFAADIDETAPEDKNTTPKGPATS